MSFEDIGLLFFTSLTLALLITPMSVKLALAIGAVDKPVARSVHTNVMPRMGGLGMAIAISMSLVLFLHLENQMIGLLSGALVIVLVGVMDDIFQISPSEKILGQVLACGLFLYFSGLRIDSFGNLFGLGDIVFPGVLSIGVTLFCMLGMINAFNLSDGLDGLAAGFTLIAGLFMGAMALHSHNDVALAVIVALLGSLLGFLKFNSHPAKLFMGDTGSLTLGYLVSCLVILLVDFDDAKAPQAITIGLILALPIVDTLVVMTRRILAGKSPVSPDKTHLHHRLMDIGLPHAGVVAVIYLLAFLFGVLGVAVHSYPSWVQLLSGLALILVIYISLEMMERSHIHLKNLMLVKSSAKMVHTHVVSGVGRSLRGLLVIIPLGLLFPLAFVESAHEAVRNVLLGAFVLLLLTFPWKEYQERTNLVCALFYLVGLMILFVWNTATYTGFDAEWYAVVFVTVLSVWSALKIYFKGHHEIFITSNFEVLLIFISWFVPYSLLPVLQVPEDIMAAAKTSCLEAIPLFIAMKIVVRRQPHRNHFLAIGLLVVLGLMLLVL